MRVSLILLLLLLCTTTVRAQEEQKVIRVGIIGLDTSHAIAFTKILHDAKHPDLAGVRVVAAFPGGSPDLPSSRDRVPEYTKQMRETFGAEIVDSIPALLERVDVVMLESVDGRPHLEQARPVFEAGKPVFIDKPLAASLADAVAIAELGKKHNVPWFSSSALRYTPVFHGARKNEKIGDVLGALAWSPSPTDPTHPDLFWYGIHGVETLFTIMGPGCESVTRTNTPGADVVTGTWQGGRTGTFRGIRNGKADYGAIVFGSKEITAMGGFGGYDPLVVEIAKFFKTKQPPVSADETLEIIAFMEAAEESKRQEGKPVKIADVMAKAREAAAEKVGN